MGIISDSLEDDKCSLCQNEIRLEYPECNFRMINVSYDNNNIDTNTIKDVSYNTSNTKKQKKKPIKTLLEELTVGEPEVEVIEGV
ncbi:16955_t:CDS:2 [Entrophospora sp. SA101]|nr:16398_t:CDS:2 [Entrophospora sp. SA101]CAJ0840220.1 16955_t:CDS:2 [Entrophospora sp. SA101]